ncbi:MAG: translocation/assembly module TamB [Bacteroides sp.]|nr:translocation/assembly module TamB [Bacteroides sp.]
MLIVAIPVLLYVPFVQDFAVKIATEQVGKSTGMKIGVGKLRLGFPLKLNVDDAVVVQANGDTMLTASRMGVDVKLMPLFKGDIEVGGAELDSAFYQLGNNDSLMWLRARIARADIDGTDINLKDGAIDLTTVDINGVNVRLRMLNDTTTTPTDTAQGKPWNVKAQRITISNLVYEMAMEPIIDSLGCRVDRVELTDGHFDMATKSISGRSLHVDSVTATYLYPLLTNSKNASADTVVTPDSQMWTITADTLSLTAKSGLYAQTGVKPLAGFDPAYIEVSDVKIEVDSFYNRGTSIRIPLKNLSANERSGLMLHADGTFTMDSKMMEAHDFSLETLRSSLFINASMGMGDLTTDPTLPLMLKASGLIDPAEIAMAFPDMKAMLKPLTPISLSADIDGTPRTLNVYTLDMRMPRLVHLMLEGEIENVMDPSKIGGQLSVSGNLSTITDKQFAFLPIKKVPALAINGTVDYYPQRVSGDVALTTGGGRLAGSGRWSGRAESYSATLNLHDFPVDAFVPEYGVGNVTASLTVDGKGYNPLSKATYIDADVKLKNIVYNKETYSDISLDATLHDGNAKGSLKSTNRDADASADFDASLGGDTVRWNLRTDVRNINLQALGFSPSINRGSLDLNTSGYYDVKTSAIDAKADVSNLTWNLPDIDIVSPKPVNLTLVSADSILDGILANGDMNLHLHSGTSLFPFITGLTAGMKEVTAQMDSMRVDVDRLHQAFPRFDMLLEMGSDNVAAKYLKEASKIEFNRLTAGVHNDSLIWLNMLANGLVSGTTRIDTISFNAIQHGQYLVYKAEMNNRPGTFDDFAHITLNGFAGTNRFSAYMKQENIKGDTGFNVGITAMLVDSVVTVKLVPSKPMIAYKPWTLNKDNFISFNLGTKHLEASLSLTGDKSSIKIYTEHPANATDSVAAMHDGHLRYDDLIVQISQVHLQDWLSINPFAPPIKGDLNADMRISYNEGVLTGKGNVGLSDLFYGREKVGDFDLNVDVANSPGGKLMADVSLMVDSVKTITAHGVLNDSTSSNPFLLDFRMIKFPLRVVNPFIPQGMATLTGMLNGEMEITGTMTHPVFNGFIDFDTTAVSVKMLGTSFAFSDEKIPVDSGIVSFNDFAIKGCNENPLHVNGTVDARNLTNLGLDLSLNAENIQIVNSLRPKGADVYGKAFLDLDATARGDMSRLNVIANVKILTGTNVTYVLSESSQSLSSQSNEDMVHFVQFNDTAAVAQADSIVSTSMALNLDARLDIEEGSIINVDLSSNGSNKIHLLPSGNVVFTMSELNGERMTGRININSGFVRYKPPIMSEKNFAFQEGSYVAFNGDMMNPILNIQAVDVIKANVTQEGQDSRLVNFDVKLSITNTLDDMNVAFDLSTDDDITVQNELASMSAEQRANQAMNMLLYNVYTGAGTKGNANLSGNQLYSFLSSQLNTWAANNIRGVDISFGIDQYDRTYGGSTSTTTSYSYRVSKTFFNDRFKIVVGGNYSTDADADENFSQNLINDISFEYMINKSGSMYIKIFRHTGYESILEGEITQTGVGFVLKRKLNTLWELFGIRRD